MGKYFTVKELTASSTADKNKIKNEPSSDEIQKLECLIETLDKIRERYGKAIYVNSGYRNSELNAKVGGVANSQHVKGEAADIDTRNKVNNRTLFDLIIGMKENGEIEFDQLIDEKNYSWIHISVKSSGNRNQILHLK